MLEMPDMLTATDAANERRKLSINLLNLYNGYAL
jgi:hypothetical protein